MAKRISTVAAPVAHLIGPGKLKVINDRLAYAPVTGDQLRLAPEALETLICYGNVTITDQAFRLLFRHQVDVSWMTRGGNRCQGRLMGMDRSTTAPRILQHQVMGQPGHRTELARWVVQNKIQSQLDALRHYQRHSLPGTGGAMRRLQQALENCEGATTVDQMRGLEGTTSATWFGVLGSLIKPPWVFRARARRPPPDPVNAMLSLGYTLLLNKVVAFCEAMGLEVNLGALHEYRAGRPSLACDLMEPLRAPAVDRWLIPYLNRKQIQPENFEQQDGGCRLKPGFFPGIVASWEKHQCDIELNRLVQEGATGLIRYLREVEANP